MYINLLQTARKNKKIPRNLKLPNTSMVGIYNFRQTSSHDIR